MYPVAGIHSVFKLLNSRSIGAPDTGLKPVSCLRYFSAHFLRYQFQTLNEHAVGSLSFHHPALMWPLGVVVIQVAVQVCLHLLHRLIPGCPPLDNGSVRPAVCDVVAR